MRRLLTNPRLIGSIVVIGALIAVALWPRAVLVETSTTVRGPLVVTINEQGATRVRDRFVVSAPVAGRVLRIELDPGDPVRRNDVVARVRAETPPLLDARTRAEAQAAVDSATAAIGRARAEEQRTKALLAKAQRELTRVRELARQGLVTPQEVDTKESDARMAEESANAAAFAVRETTSELQRARARLAPPGPDQSGRVVDVRAPVDGVVLKRLRESETVVPAGDPLIEIGDPRRLEIVSDLLSTDAVRVTPGARTMIEQWGGNRVLEGRVRRIEPAGFTKISALGVEEQRVNVIIDFKDPVEAWTALGDAYRVEVRIVVWESASVLKVPTSALYREGDQWAVYAMDKGRARRMLVDLGHQTGQEAEVRSGLAEGTRVIVHPADTVRDKARVKERNPAPR